MAEQNRKILVLDDEPGILDAYRMLLTPSRGGEPILSSRRKSSAVRQIQPLTSLEIEAQYVTTGLDALALIENGLKNGQPLAGGFFDVKLGPGIDGIETIRRAKELDPDFLCVIVSAYQDRDIDEITRIFGEDYADRWDFLTKPFNRSEILQKARNLLSNWDRRKREKEYLEQIKAQQDMLIQQERLAAMGTLARGIGHEFGNVLMRIIGRAEIAQQTKSTHEMESALKLIASAAERAGVIVRNLQSLVRTEAKREPCDIRTPLNDSLTLVEHELKKANITVETEHPPKLPLVPMNRVEIGQVLLNLIINASHAMEKGGVLTFRTRTDRDGVILEVRDTGCGIPAENLGRIFEPLFSTKGEKGSGIGLSVSRRIMESHGGRLTVQSTVGEGTLFELWLPLAVRAL